MKREKSQSWETNQPLLIMYPNNEVGKTMKELEVLRHFTDRYRNRRNCGNCLTLRYHDWADFITKRCPFIGKMAEKSMFDDFVQQLAKRSENNQIFNNMNISFVPLENENHMLILWSHTTTNIIEALGNFVKSKYGFKNGWRAYYEDCYSSRFWETKGSALKFNSTNQSNFQENMTTFKKILIRNKEMDSRTGSFIDAGLFRTYEIDSFMHSSFSDIFRSTKTIRVIQTSKNSDISSLSRICQIMMPEKEYPVTEVYSGYLSAIKLCIIKSPEYDLKTLVTDFLNVLKYERKHVCLNCQKYTENIALYDEEMMSKTDIIEAKTRLQNNALIFNNRGGLFEAKSRFKDAFTKHFCGGIVSKHFPSLKLTVKKRTISFAKLKDNDGNEEMILMLRDPNLTLNQLSLYASNGFTINSNKYGRLLFCYLDFGLNEDS